MCRPCPRFKLDLGIVADKGSAGLARAHHGDGCTFAKKLEAEPRCPTGTLFTNLARRERYGKRQLHEAGLRWLLWQLPRSAQLVEGCRSDLQQAPA